MADLSDVEQALVSFISAALYPDGTDAVAINGTFNRIYRGWPEAAALDEDLLSGYVNVTVFPEAGGRNTTRGMNKWLDLARTSPTLKTAVVGNSIAFSGSADPGQLVGILADSATYVHSIGSKETPALVAADLAALMREDRIVLLSGASILVPGATRLLIRVVATQPAIMQTRRQEQRFRISFWCNDPMLRDATAAVIDAALAQPSFIPLSDGSAGRLRYHGTAVLDEAQDAFLYRRDLIYSVEYPTTLVALLPRMLFGDLTLQTAQQVSVTVNS